MSVTNAFWDDGHQVSIPGKVLAELETAWRQAAPWSVRPAFMPDHVADQPEILDGIERHLNETAALEAVKQQRSILTCSGPRWSLQAVGLRFQPELNEQADYCPWTRGTPLPDGGAWWLVCRMSGLSIPLLPEETS